MNNIDSLLGLSMKAGLLVSGEFMVEKTIKNQTAKLVIIAGDASDNTKKKFSNQCKFRNIDYIEYKDKENLGRAIGKEMRATLAVCDEGFAKSIKRKLSDSL